MSSDKVHVEDRYKLLSDVAIEAIALSENKIIFDCNQQFVDLYGYDSIEEVMGLSIDDFTVEEQKEFVEELLNQEESDKVEIINKKKDGSLVVIESRGKYMNLDGKRIRVSVMYDITKRKQMEVELKHREEKIATLVSHFPGMAYRCQCYNNGKVDYVSEGCKELTGYTVEDFIDEKIVLEDLIDKQFSNIREHHIKQSTSTYSFEYKLKDKKKNNKWVWEKGNIIFDEFGNKIAEGFISDITSKKNYEKQLEESSKQYKDLIENSPDGIVIHNQNIQYANPTFVKMIGAKSIDDVIGKRLPTLLTQFCTSAQKQKIKKLLDKKQYDYVEITYVDEKENEYEWGINSIESSFKGKHVAQTTITDITYEKRLDQEKVRLRVTQELNNDLQEENRRYIETQKRLVEAESYSRSIINSSLDMIIAVNTEGEITDFNKAAINTFGYKAEEIIGRNVNILYDSNFDFVSVRKALKDKGEYHGEVINKTKEGVSFTTILSASLIINNEGEVLGSMGISRDITKIKLIEQELKASEGRYRDLLENVTEYIISIDTDGKFLFINDAFKKAMGYTEREFLNSHLVDMLSPERKDNSKRIIEKIIAGEMPNPINTVFLTKKGKKLILEGNTSVKYKHYKPESIRGIFRDITESKEVEQIVKTQAAKMKSIFDSSSNVLMWTMNINHEITSMNQTFKNVLWKYSEKDLKVGSIFYRELGPHIKPGYYQELMLNKFIGAFSGKPQQFEVCMLDTYNKDVWFEVFLSPIILDDQEYVTEVACMAHEITDKKEALSQIEKNLQEKDVLLKEVHHRVKNNLQVISSILNLQSSLVEDEKTLQILKESQSRIRTMSFIHESLYRAKDFSEINFTEYVGNLSKNLVRSYTIASHIDLKLELQDVNLSLDQSIPAGLLINEIVTNSLKYAFPNNEDGIIGVNLSQKNEDITLEVYDNGIGLPEKKDDEQADTLGTQLIEALVDQLDAELNIKNDGGTKYLITFRKLN